MPSPEQYINRIGVSEHWYGRRKWTTIFATDEEHQDLMEMEKFHQITIDDLPECPEFLMIIDYSY